MAEICITIFLCSVISSVIIGAFIIIAANIIKEKINSVWHQIYLD